MGRWDDDYEDDEQEFVTPTESSNEEGLTRKTREDDDEQPTPRVIKKGWSSSDDRSNSDNAYAVRLKVSEETQIVKFLEDMPYANYKQHWIERQGQKSFTCIADAETGTRCPLCEAGNRPSWRFNFNVILLTPNQEPVLRSYEVGARVSEQLKNFNDHPAMGPLYKHYWTVSRTGKGATTSTNHQMVKESDLEDWGLKALSKDQLTSFEKEMYTSDIIRMPASKTLATIALEISED